MTPLLTGVFASQITGKLNVFSPTGSYDALATYTVPSGGVSEIKFAGLPTGGQYKHLQIRCILKGTVNSNSEGATNFIFNDNVSSIYTGHSINGNGSSASVGGGGPYTGMGMGYMTGSGSNTTNTFSSYIIDVLDYADTTKYKTWRSLGGYDLNGAEGSVFFSSNSYMSLLPVSSVTLKGNGATIAQNSQIAVYGVKG